MLEFRMQANESDLGAWGKQKPTSAVGGGEQDGP